MTPDPSENKGGGFMKSLWAEIHADLDFGVKTDGGSTLYRAFSNRGFHALCCYRVAHRLRKTPLAFVGFILTRLSQLVYGIDLDPRAEIAGGVIIYHGVGLVVGGGAHIEERVVLFHGVTLGIKRSDRKDGFPYLEADTVIGAGAKLLGALRVGCGSIIGANAVVSFDVPPRSIVRPPRSVVAPMDIESLAPFSDHE